MNSTLNRVLFWMVFVVVGVLVWKFSTTFQTHERPVAPGDWIILDDGSVPTLEARTMQLMPATLYSRMLVRTA
jgi:hypothetical protein